MSNHIKQTGVFPRSLQKTIAFTKVLSNAFYDDRFKSDRVLSKVWKSMK